MLKRGLRRLLVLLAFSLGLPSTVEAFPRPLPPEEGQFVKLLAALPSEADMGRRVVAAARLFLGKPYVAGSLNVNSDPSEPETLVCRLDAFDCVTLVEVSVALARTHGREGRDWKIFQSELESLRYRGGQRRGYASRLHYFSDWLRDNAARGVVQDLTPALGGLLDTRPLNFMTSHRSAYRQLAHEQVWRDVRKTEEALSRLPRPVIPKNRLADAIPLIQSGDILAFTTGVQGLDVAHVGLAVRLDDGNLHVLHAPEKGQNVQITRQPLVPYTQSVAGHTGLMVARPLALRTRN